MIDACSHVCFRTGVSVTWIVFSLALLAGCCPRESAESARKSAEAREWLRNWPGAYDWVEVYTWRNVAPSHLAEAEQLLGNTTLVVLAEKEANDFAEQPRDRSLTARWHPYLLRGVNSANNRFPLEVFVRPNGDVWVGGGANSLCPVPMERRAVVVWLTQKPNETYLTFVVGK